MWVVSLNVVPAPAAGPLFGNRCFAFFSWLFHLLLLWLSKTPWFVSWPGLGSSLSVHSTAGARQCVESGGLKSVAVCCRPPLAGSQGHAEVAPGSRPAGGTGAGTRHGPGRECPEAEEPVRPGPRQRREAAWELAVQAERVTTSTGVSMGGR